MNSIKVQGPRPRIKIMPRELQTIQYMLGKAWLLTTLGTGWEGLDTVYFMCFVEYVQCSRYEQTLLLAWLMVTLDMCKIPKENVNLYVDHLLLAFFNRFYLTSLVY